MHEDEALHNEDISLDELDAVAGGAAGADAPELEGQVLEVLPNAMLRVQLDEGDVILCHLGAKLRMNFIRVLTGDRVRVKMDMLDPSQGRVVYRYRRV